VPRFRRRAQPRGLVTVRESNGLRDPAVRARARRDCDRYWRFIHRGEWERVRLQGSVQVPELAGKTFVEISEAMGKDPWDCYFDSLAAAGPDLNSLVLMGTLFTEEHISDMVRHPLFNLAVDIWSSRVDGPLSERTKHPLYFAGHIRYLTRYVRELGVIRPEDAIRKMTSMPAAYSGLHGRGCCGRAPLQTWWCSTTRVREARRPWSGHCRTPRVWNTC
jgi:N-acyl-D-amino-acid deacylase